MSGLRALTTALLLAACATTPAPIPVLGDVAQLTGEWAGEYQGHESGRSGSIVFTLAAGSDTAHGDVLMVPRGALQAVHAGLVSDRIDSPLHDTVPHPTVLRIAFTRVGDGRVSGSLDPYRSPDCGCLLSTTFTGSLDGDVIRGTYISVHRSGEFERGSWTVKRRRGG